MTTNLTKSQINKKKKSDRSRGNYLKRKKANINIKPTFLIVCEGKNTEPSYFNQFRLKTANIEIVGEGYNTISLVNKTIELVAAKKYDQVWCVFDKDDFKNDSFDNAITKAKSHGLRLAYSNQAFEYWILLHLNDHQGGTIHRSDYNSMINKLLTLSSVTYNGKTNKLISKELFDFLLATDKNYHKRRIDLAISRAKKIIKQKEGLTPAKQESSTTVYKLVEEILKYI